jgi:hypothetical protein
MKATPSRCCKTVPLAENLACLLLAVQGGRGPELALNDLGNNTELKSRPLRATFVALLR